MICRLLVALCVGFGGSVYAMHTVYLVQSDRGEAVGLAAQALVSHLVEKGTAASEIRSVFADDPELSVPPHEGVRVVVTVGSAALRAVLARPGRTPVVIATLVPKHTYERELAQSPRRGVAFSAALYLDQPIGRQLDLLALALPKARRVGVVWGEESMSQQQVFAVTAQQRGLEPVVGMATGATALGAALRTALQDADAFVALPDGQVFNASTVASVLITSYRSRVPVLAFSPAWVRSGALLSLHTSAPQAGTLAASMVRAYLQSGVLPPSQYPQEFEVTVNDLVARSLGLSLNAADLHARLRALEKRP
jgi:ABC-type uncharacterized transport system substrate-binding protein